MNTGNISIERLNYDSDRELAMFQIKADHGGKRCAVNGYLHVATPGDMAESEVQAKSKAELKVLLRAISDAI